MLEGHRVGCLGQAEGGLPAGTAVAGVVKKRCDVRLQWRSQGHAGNHRFGERHRKASATSASTASNGNQGAAAPAATARRSPNHSRRAGTGACGAEDRISISAATTEPAPNSRDAGAIPVQMAQQTLLRDRRHCLLQGEGQEHDATDDQRVQETVGIPGVPGRSRTGAVRQTLPPALARFA